MKYKIFKNTNVSVKSKGFLKSAIQVSRSFELYPSPIMVLGELLRLHPEPEDAIGFSNFTIGFLDVMGLPHPN